MLHLCFTDSTTLSLTSGGLYSPNLKGGDLLASLQYQVVEPQLESGLPPLPVHIFIQHMVLEHRGVAGTMQSVFPVSSNESSSVHKIKAFTVHSLMLPSQEPRVADRIPPDR